MKLHNIGLLHFLISGNVLKVDINCSSTSLILWIFLEYIQTLLQYFLISVLISSIFTFKLMLGFECTKRLRKIEASISIQDTNSERRDHHQLLIVCSANSDEETANLAYDAGVDGFLEKPLDMDTFMKVYKNLKDIEDNSS